MATLTRTFTVTADETLIDHLDQAMAFACPTDADGQPSVAGEAHTTYCVTQWLTNAAATYAAAQARAQVAQAQQAAADAIAQQVTINVSTA
jgi:hypothetical protein